MNLEDHGNHTSPFSSFELPLFLWIPLYLVLPSSVSPSQRSLPPPLPSLLFFFFSTVFLLFLSSSASQPLLPAIRRTPLPEPTSHQPLEKKEKKEKNKETPPCFAASEGVYKYAPLR